MGKERERKQGKEGREVGVDSGRKRMGCRGREYREPGEDRDRLR